jgi:exonuclease SbcC
LSAHWATRPAGEQGELEEAAARLEDAQAVYAAADAALQAAMAHAATASHQLAAHEAALIAQQATLARAKVVEAELRIVEDIAKLIGTNDGAGFEKIVQALNLQSLLVRANARLARFLDRYQLEQIVEHRGAPRLDFRVVDLHQSGVRRTIKSLSGGESFIVSMALALGLADVVQSLNGGVRLDTLFIDEGFGSLDAETLNRAMDLIDQISQHRAVGLISHVEAMQKSIFSQVRVAKSPAGSTVTVVNGDDEDDDDDDHDDDDGSWARIMKMMMTMITTTTTIIVTMTATSDDDEDDDGDDHDDRDDDHHDDGGDE